MQSVERAELADVGTLFEQRSARRESGNADSAVVEGVIRQDDGGMVGGHVRCQSPPHCFPLSFVLSLRCRAGLMDGHDALGKVTDSPLRP